MNFRNMIKVCNLTKIYNKNKPNQIVALDNISLDINTGDFIAIMGPSGAGKSTLLHMISGIDNYDSGNIIVDEYNFNYMKKSEYATYRNKKIGIILQNFALINDLTVYENIEIPLLFSNYDTKMRKKLVEDCASKFGIERYLNTTVLDLSGGEKQRVAIARSVINNPSIILADEPTGSLDSTNSDIVMNLFKKLNEENITIIMITHDDRIASFAKRIIYIKDGKISD